MAEAGLIESIKEIPPLDGEVYYDNISYDEVYYDGSLIWKKKNDKNNPDNNWTKGPVSSQWFGNGVNNYYPLKANGTTYNYYIRSSRNGDSSVYHSISCSGSIPIPKGVKTISISCEANGYDHDGGRGGTASMSLKDNTTGETLKTTSQPNTLNPGHTLTYSCTKEQAIHDLVLTFSCTGWGRGYRDCHAWAGLSNWSFTYY